MWANLDTFPQPADACAAAIISEGLNVRTVTHFLSSFLRNRVLRREKDPTRRPRGAAQEGFHRWSSQHTAYLQQTSLTCQTCSPTEKKHTFDPLGLRGCIHPLRGDNTWAQRGKTVVRVAWLRPHDAWRRGSLLEPERWIEMHFVSRADRGDRRERKSWKLFSWSQPEW